MNIQIRFSKEQWLELALILILISTLFSIGPANLLDKKVSHNHPFNILSSDAAGEISFVEGLIRDGDYLHMSATHCAGFDDCIGFIPYLFQHLAAVYSLATGVPTSNVNLFMTSIFLIFGVLLLYLILKRWNKHIAVLSLPLSIFLFQPQFRIGLTWGYYDTLIACVFVLGAIYAFTEENRKNYWIIFSIFLSAAFLDHVSESVYVLLIVGTYILFSWLSQKKIPKADILFFLKSGILTFILCSYLIFLLLFVWHFPSQASGAAEWYDPLFSHFQWVQYLLIIGVVLSLLLFKKKHAPIPILLGLGMLFFGLNPLHIHAFRTFQIRYLWPLYLAVFLGITLYFALSLLPIKKTFASIILSAAILITLGSLYYQPQASPGLISQEHWDMINWIKEETPEESTVTFLYGDPYNQNAMLSNTFRTVFLVYPNSFIEKIENQQITNLFEGRLIGPNLGYYYWKEPFVLGSYTEEKGEEYFFGERNICLSDYVVFDIVSGQPVFAQYNALLGQHMLDSKSFVISYQNSRVVTLKNILYNETCIPQGDLNA